jgi:uncharacterized protein YdhG (YjbR/CyaY superfamily)
LTVQRALAEVRAAIKAALPTAEECITYGMPAFQLQGKVLVAYGAFKSHIGFYPGRAAIAQFANELAAYKQAKGSVQFPLDEPMPSALIQRIVTFAVRERARRTPRRAR